MDVSANIRKLTNMENFFPFERLRSKFNKELELEDKWASFQAYEIRIFKESELNELKHEFSSEVNKINSVGELCL